MKKLIIVLGLWLLPLGVWAQKPPAGLAPMGALGDFSEMEKTILFNSLQEYLSTHYALASQKAFEQAQDAAFEELDYEECTEDQCFAVIQQILQVDNLFLFNVTREGTFTQLSLTAVNLDSERLVRTAVCDQCGIGELNAQVEGMVLKIVEATQPASVAASESVAPAGTRTDAAAGTPEPASPPEPEPVAEKPSSAPEPVVQADQPASVAASESVAPAGTQTDAAAGTPEPASPPEPVAEKPSPMPEPVVQAEPEPEPEVRTSQSSGSNWIWHAVTLGVTGVAMLQAKSAADDYNTLSSRNKELASLYASNPSASYSAEYTSNQSEMKSLKSSAETYDLITYIGLGVEVYLLLFTGSGDETAYQPNSRPMRVLATNDSFKVRFQWQF